MITRTTFRKGSVARSWCALFLFAAAFFAAAQATIVAAEAAQAVLSWSAPTTNADGTPATDLAGFNLYWGSAPGNYDQSLNVGSQTSYTLYNLSDGSTYYFAVTAYDTSLMESGFSNEASKSFPGQTPVYAITATAGSGGTLEALNNPTANQASNGPATVTGVSVNQGASQQFAVTAAAGYEVQDVVVDGFSIGPVSSYSFSAVNANHTISASFAVKQLQLPATPGTDGDTRDGILNAAPGKTAPDLADAMRALRIAIKEIIPTVADQAHGDVAPLDASGIPYGDGKLDISDALGILRLSVGLQ